MLKDAVKSGVAVDMHEYRATCTSILRKAADEKKALITKESQKLISNLSEAPKRTLERIVKNSASTWLTVLPLRADSYDLSATQFRDQLAIRYHREPAGLPKLCDGCGEPFHLQHGLDCKKGGLVKKGHDELRDFDTMIANVAFGGVVVEPVLQPESEQQQRRHLQADWMARGVWEGSRVAFFDNRIVDADAPSYSAAHLSWEAVSNKAAAEKKKKYKLIAEELRGTITPLVCSTDGALHTEYKA